MLKVHLDTDIGGDIDDLCALTMLLQRPDVDLVGVTTVADDAGGRAGYARYVLRIAGCDMIPLASGADVGSGVYRTPMGYPPERDYWPEPITPFHTPVAAALDLLAASIAAGATIVAIGPFTNLRLLEERQPGILARANLVLMGGYVYLPRPGFPQWGNEMDWNVQSDMRSAALVLAQAQPTLVTLSMTVETALRRAHLARLRLAGPLGQLIARQAEVFSRDWDNEMRLGLTCPGLPHDAINFQHDPLAAAIALGWRKGVEISEIPLIVEMRDGWLVERPNPAGKPFRVVTRVDGLAFSEAWVGWLEKGLGEEVDKRYP
jgi:purine nucleosidase